MGNRSSVQRKRVPKRKVAISISGAVHERLMDIGAQYGLNFSNMIERAARYYLAEIEDLEIAMWRDQNREGEPMTHDKFRKTLMDS